MSNNRTKGRMIKRDISNSKKFSSLSPQAAVLFCMIIPHLNSYGKLNGGPGFIKDEICPRIEYITLQMIPDLLREITEHTNMKWFEHDERYYIHSINFLTEHQDLKPEKLGQDLLPTYSGVTPNLVPHEVEVEVKDEVKEKTCPEPCSEPEYSFILKDGSSFKIPPEKVEEWHELYEGVEVEKELQKIAEWSENNRAKRKTRDGAMRFVCSWLNRAEQNFKEKIGDRDNLFEMEVERVIHGYS